MQRLQILLTSDGWLQFKWRRLRPDFTTGQIHRWRLRLGPIEVRGWKNFEQSSVA